MRNQKNTHNFPVLQQDIPVSHRANQENIAPAGKTQKKNNIKNNQPSSNFQSNPNNNNRNPQTNLQPNNTNPQQNENLGNFFDEVINTTENNKEREPLTIEQAQKKEKKKIFTFKPDLLLDSTKGLKALYVNMEKYKIIKEGSSQTIDEFNQLHKMMRLIKDWHFLCVPRYDFNYFLNRCQEYGTKPIIKSHLTRMRKVHKGLMRWEDIEPTEEVIAPINDSSTIPNNQKSFVPQELINNIRNLNAQASQNITTDQIGSNINHATSTMINENVNIASINPNLNKFTADEVNLEDVDDLEINGEIPAEIMNAPSFDGNFNDDLENIPFQNNDGLNEGEVDIETYELEKNRKKIKNDEENLN